MTTDELIVRLLQEGVQIPVLSRASGISEDDLYGLGIEDQSEALPEAALSLAWMGIQEGKNILRSGTQSNRLRLVAIIFSQVMRSYKGETPKAMQDLMKMTVDILEGKDVAVDDEPELS